MEKLRVAIAQIDLEWENPSLNRSRIGHQIHQISDQCDLILLPETFTTGFTSRATDLAESMSGSTIKWLTDLASKTGAAIGGTLLVKEDHCYFNRFVFVTPHGEITCYDKRHLFSIGGETEVFCAGRNRVIVDFKGWKIALYICYDLRFPVWCRNQKDTDLMLFPANWPASRQAVWNLLLKARAIENQVYVAGINRVGKDGNGIIYVGESQIINAKGESVSRFQSVDGVWQIYEISKNELDDFRLRFPVGEDADDFELK